MLSSLSKLLFSRRKREREPNEDLEEISKEDNMLYSIKMKKKKENQEKSSYCPHCASEKLAKIYCHMSDNKHNNNAKVVRNINFNNPDEAVVKEENEEESEEDIGREYADKEEEVLFNDNKEYNNQLQQDDMNQIYNEKQEEQEKQQHNGEKSYNNEKENDDINSDHINSNGHGIRESVNKQLETNLEYENDYNNIVANYQSNSTNHYIKNDYDCDSENQYPFDDRINQEIIQFSTKNKNNKDTDTNNSDENAKVQITQDKLNEAISSTKIQNKAFQLKSIELPKNSNGIVQEHNPSMKSSIRDQSIKPKSFLQTTKQFLYGTPIDNLFDQAFNYIKTRKYHRILNAFTKEEFITCIE